MFKPESAFGHFLSGSNGRKRKMKLKKSIAAIGIASMVAMTPLSGVMAAPLNTNFSKQYATVVKGAYSESRDFLNFWVVTTPAGLNVRTGPGTQYKKAGTIPGGTVIYGKKTTGGWLKIETGKYDGYYVSLNYIKSAYFERSSVTVKTAGADLMLRKGPSTDFGIVSRIPNGSTLIVEYKSTNGWYLVVYRKGNNSYSGWVSSKYCKAINTSSR